MAAQKEYYGHCIKGKLPWGIRCVFYSKPMPIMHLMCRFLISQSHYMSKLMTGRIWYIFTFLMKVSYINLLFAQSTVTVKLKKSFQSTLFICLLNMPKIITQLVMCIMDYTGLIMASQILSQKITAIF